MALRGDFCGYETHTSLDPALQVQKDKTDTAAFLWDFGLQCCFCLLLGALISCVCEGIKHENLSSAGTSLGHSCCTLQMWLR